MREIPRHKIRFGKNGDPSNTNLTATTASRWEDVWSYQVPEKSGGILLKPGDTVSAYITSNTNSEITSPDGQFQIVYKNSSKMAEVNVFGPANYGEITAFQDRNKKATLIIKAPIHVKPLEWIVFRVKDNAAMVAADITTTSYGHLETTRIER